MFEDFEWKYWENGTFQKRKFKNENPAIGYDFFYKEIFHWDDASPTKCCYEMYDILINAGDIVVDLGANLGFFTKKAALTASRVISVEASPEHFSCLVENTHDMENVEYVNAIVIGEDVNKEEKHTKNVYSNKCSKSTITISEIMERHGLDRIDFLKVDIEGAEYELLQNTPIEVLNKIDKIAIEMHGHFFPEDPEKDERFFLPNKIRNSWIWLFNNGNDFERFYYFKNFS